MRPQSLSSLDAMRAAALKAVFADVDHTCTDMSGRFDERLFYALKNFSDAGLKFAFATGRAAAFALALRCYIPYIEGVICENGAIYYSADPREKPEFLRPGLRGSKHRIELEAAYAEMKAVYPKLVRTDDDSFRLTEIALVKEPWITSSDIDAMREIAKRRGLAITHSSVHLHVLAPDVNKWAMIEKIAPSLGAGNPRDEVITVGDSVNDEPLFSPLNVAASVGVAQASECLAELGGNAPAYITVLPAAGGLLELSETLLRLKKG